MLLLAYSLGLGVPFMLVALLLGRLAGTLAWLKRHSRAINRTAGVILMLLGIAIATDTLGRVVLFLSRFLPLSGTA
jgi:cytochrome c-type biogenesis protein